MINHDPHKNKMEITHFFNKTKKIQISIKPKINLIIMHKFILHQIMKNIITKIINNYTPTKDLVLTVLSFEQPDVFEPYTRNEQIRKPRNHPTSHNIIFQQQNPVNTQSYQPTQMRN